MIDWETFSHDLSQSLDRDLEILSTSSVSGGDIHKAYHLHTNHGDYFLKTNDKKALALFESEAHSLRRISETQTLIVPSPLAVGETTSQAWLLMNHLEFGSKGDDRQRGRDLAFLHQQIEPHNKFGWDQDNYIGHTLQKNSWQYDWLTFYGQYRLQFQLDLARENGASPHLYEQGLAVIEALPRFFDDYTPKASMLHGDLWAGNSGFLTNGDAVFFDPASYYGDRETDLAMTELFGGYTDDFYHGYREVFPIHEGYERRKPLYNLYHVLNHFNLFGGGYAHQAQRLMEQLLR